LQTDKKGRVKTMCYRFELSEWPFEQVRHFGVFCPKWATKATHFPAASESWGIRENMYEHGMEGKILDAKRECKGKGPH
jgi:hypothetical protein